MNQEANAPTASIIRPAFHSYVVLPLAFLSGFIIMSIELLGGRILAPYFGSSIYVWGSIITVFMLSLSIGYLTGGKLSIDNPSLGRYGAFFIIAALMLMPSIIFGENIMDWVFVRIEDPRYGSLIASMFLFFFPTSSAQVRLHQCSVGRSRSSPAITFFLKNNNIFLIPSARVRHRPCSVGRSRSCPAITF